MNEETQFHLADDKVPGKPEAGQTVPAVSSAHDLSFLAAPAQAGHIGRLGHYEVLDVVGQGGFGIVLKAFDEKLQRVVAIKVLAPAFAAHAAARKRFIREARTAAVVKNEHVVAIYSVEDDAQPPYLVMELVEGLSLQDKLDRRGPVSLKEILRIGVETAAGLAAAHKQGLVHRDIKPANILLENGGERVKITDFGLARAVDDASVTQAGTVAGTPMYMSPEQAEGLSVDHRSDLFSLGSVLYVLCTGEPPFRASGTHAVLKRVIDASPRPIREINKEIPDWLGAIVAKLHAKDPAERFQSARDVAELLGQHLAHVQQSGLTPRPPDIIVPGRRAQVRRWRRPLVIGVLFLGIALVFFALQPSSKTVNFPGTVRSDVMPKGVKVPGSVDLLRWGTFVDPQKSCILQRAADAVVITVPGTRPYNMLPLAGYNVDAPRLVDYLEGDFVVQVSIPSFPRPSANTSSRAGGWGSFRAAGLLLWSDAANLLRFERAGFGEGIRSQQGGILVAQNGVPYVHAEWYQAGRLGGDEMDVLPDIPDGPTHLQIERRGIVLHLRRSHDGMTWSDWKTVVFPDLPAKIAVGLLASNSTRTEFAPRFENLRLRKSKGPAEPPFAVAPFDAQKAREHQDAWAKHLGVLPDITNSLGMKLRLIPPGEFTMGATATEVKEQEPIFAAPAVKYLRSAAPAHKVRITRPTALGADEVTVGQFAAFVRAKNHVTLAEKEGTAGAPNELGQGTYQRGRSWKEPGWPQADDFPVVAVSWHDAVAFCTWLSQKERRQYRLPTEAEWEHACRAGTTAPSGFGPLVNAEQAVFGRGARGRPEPIGGRAGNAFGLRDMHGNVHEWCLDSYHEGYYHVTPVADPPGPHECPERVLRGQAFDSLAQRCTSFYRFGRPAEYRAVTMGFRVTLVDVGRASEVK